MLRWLGALTLILAIGACSPTYVNHGWVPAEDELSFIVPGVDNQGTVEESIGRPSANGVLRDEAWFYVASRQRRYAYFAPQTVEREIVAISFDDEGTVTNIERFGLEDGQVVQLSRRVTESTIRGTTLFSQILRNLGRIDLGEIVDGDN